VPIPRPTTRSWSLRWGYLDLPGWSHSRTPYRGIPEGLAFVFDGAEWEVSVAAKAEALAGHSDPLLTVDSFVTAPSEKLGTPVGPSVRWFRLAGALYAGANRPAEAVMALNVP